MPSFHCPICEQRTITPSQKWGASSFDPATCPGCHARVYPSGGQSSLWRSVEALLVTLVVIRALIDFAWGLLLVALLIIVVMETLRQLLVPLVTLEHRSPSA